MKTKKATAGKTAKKTKTTTKKAAALKETGKQLVKELKEKKQELLEPKETVKKFEPKKTERDTTTYNFGEHKGLGKSRFLLEMVRAWVKAHPKADLKKMEEAWPHNLIHRYGVWAPYKEAVERSNPRKRYFTDEKDVLLVDGKKVCVCNQITKPIIDDILEHAKKSGAKVK